MLRRLTQFPLDLAKCTQHPYMFSPDFSMYLDVDRKGKKFLIRDSFTQNKVTDIPEYIMNCKDEHYEEAAARFKWQDNDTLKVINSEGIERLVDIKTKKPNSEGREFKEIEFNVIPLFQENMQMREDMTTHYYYEKVDMSVRDTLKRLIFKYQEYKSAYYLDKSNDLY